MDEYKYLQSKRWRGISYDWDTLSRYGNETKLYCLTDFQASWLLSNTAYISWPSRWQNCPCTDDDLEVFKAELDYALMSCIDLQPFQLDYNYNQAVKQELDALDALYNGTPSSVNPNTPDDFFSGDGSTERIDALCNAVTVYCYTYSANWQTKAQIALGVVSVVGALASISIVGGVIASVLVGGLFYLTQVAYDAMSDTDALNDVVCCMRDNMNGLAVTQANFETSLQGCGFMVGSNQQIIVDIISSDMGELGNYLSFLNALGDQLQFASVGVSVCPCVEPVWSHEFDFVNNGAEGWTPFIGRALLVAGGWEGTVADANAVQIETTFPGTANITRMEVFNSGLAGGPCATTYNFRFPDVGGADGIFPSGSSVVNANVTSDGMWFSMCYGGDLSVKIQRILLEGTGVNPF